MVSKILLGMSTTTNIHFLQFKIQSHLQKRGIRTHTEEKPKHFNITFAIVPFSRKNTSTKLPS